MEDKIASFLSKLEEKFQYGGLLPTEGSAPRFDLFARKTFVTFEMVGFADTNDPYDFLRGNGTLQSHRPLRLTPIEDLATQHVDDYFEMV